MKSYNVGVFVIASAAYIWRLLDPTGSYKVLYNSSAFFMSLAYDNEAFSRAAGMYLIDQFNGFVLGILGASIVPVLFLSVQFLIAPRKTSEAHSI